MRDGGVRAWLSDLPWDLVVYQNAALCEARNAHHGPSSDGHDAARSLWEAAMNQEMSLMEVVELCKRCHRLAPFTNYNGNTFAAIARTLIRQLSLPDTEDAVARSLAGHIVAGVASDVELKEFRNFCEGLAQRKGELDG